jgi:hypothetical protein
LREAQPPGNFKQIPCTEKQLHVKQDRVSVRVAFHHGTIAFYRLETYYLIGKENFRRKSLLSLTRNNNMKITPYCIVLLLITACSGEQQKKTPPLKLQKNQATQKTLFAEPWNKTFQLRETENGEILTIGAVCIEEDTVFIYDLAAGAVVLLDSSGGVLKTVKLASIGRNTYRGDDFIVKDSSFIFLNSVDRRLEFFNRTTGKHRRAVPLPADLLSHAKKRSWQTLSRLFLDGNHLMIGNEHFIVAFDPSLGKRLAIAVTASGTEEQRFLLYRKKASLMLRDSLIENRLNDATYRQPVTHHPISGKRFFTKGNRIFSIDAGKDSVRIAEVK